MMRFFHLPRLTRWLLWIGLVLLLMMTLMRLGLYLGFNRQGTGPAGALSAFFLGLRYDLRTISIILLVVLILGSLPPLHPFRHARAGRWWRRILGIVVLLMVLFYVVDFAHYAYLLQRLNASVLNYLGDASISMNMVWQSYPVIWLVLGLVLVAVLFAWLIRLGYRRIRRIQQPVSKRSRIWTFIVSFLVLGFFIFGRFNQFPLRWSDAFALGSDYKANLALNPFQSFFSTLKFRHSDIDMEAVKAYYPTMSRLLGLPAADSATLNYTRNRPADTAMTGQPPNIILVICESFSAYKSSMWGNPLNTTPFFDSLCRNGLFFDHCFTPTYGTARGVWATITGIPDVEQPTTASRNPQAVDQRTIINDFTGYDKYYFIGGSPSWANIRGLLMNNIRDLQLYEEENMNAPKLDVWGISDKNLFMEANRILSGSRKPFFAVIQTADNHRPYSIPEEDLKEFKPVAVDADSLRHFGFDKVEELNAFRYTDFCFEKFFAAARQSDYYANTIFIFVGDHGIPGNAGQMFPQAWTEQRLTAEHVPLLFYSPSRITPMRVNRICSQVDILPTIAGICGISYQNSTLGRDLTDSTRNLQPAAFIFDPEYRQRGVIANGYFYREQINSNKEEMVPVLPDSLLPAGIDQAALKDSLRRMSRAMYHTSKYLLLNNKKQ